jgi:hypothetical protein
VSPAEFIADVAWPLTVLTIALLFRKPLTEALASATGRVAAGPFSLEWKRRVTDVEGDLGLSSSIPDGEVGGAAGKLDEIAQVSPTAAIVEAFGQVEAALRQVLEARGVKALDDPWSVRHVAEVARDKGVITTETYDAIEGLSVLRNLAAHGGEKDISRQRAQEFVALAQGVIYAITNNAKRDAS